MNVIKRSGEEVVFDASKIENAIKKANKATTHNQMTDELIHSVTQSVIDKCENLKRSPNVEEIQDMVEGELMEHRCFAVAHNYITYRYERALIRKANSTDKQIMSLLERNNEEVKQENSNKNPLVNSVQRDYMAGEVSKDITKRFLLPQDVMEAHEKGIIHFHDSDYFAQHMHNCCLVNLEDMLQNGTVISETMIEKPHSFSTACNVATQIIAQVASSQYGGQSITLSHLAPFVQVSREKARREVKEELESLNLDSSEDTVNKMAEMRVRKEIEKGVQMIQYQVITLMTTNGQAPFSTIYLEIEDGNPYEEEMAMICEEMIRQRLEGMKNYKGQEIGEAFPKLVYLLDEHNCLEGGKYDYITKLAAKCTAKRLVPDYQSAKIMRENYEGNTFPPMGCRSHLSPWKDEKGNYKFYGRFNQGVVSLNLPQIAIMADKDMEMFWEMLDRRLELCKDALMTRHKMLLGVTSDSSPIHWQHGAIARLKKGEKIDKLLKDGYSTISLGYVGIAEMVQAMLGVTHTSKEGEKFALEVMNYMKEKCDKWKAETGLGFGLYGTPAESLIYRFCRIDKARFGEIQNVTDKLYYTNSYHVHVCEEIDAFSKLKFESQFHSISNGGCISYIEVPDMNKNVEAVEDIINFIYHNIQYAEINTKSDVCYKCGFNGEMELDRESLTWHCPSCGNDDESELQVMRRTCGYIGSSYWNKGRTAEIGDRVLHL